MPLAGLQDKATRRNNQPPQMFLRRASRRRRATVKRRIASQPLRRVFVLTSVREGCLHVTPLSQETGEVRNLDSSSRFVLANPELTGLQGLYLQTLS
jgi:molybdopterin biosynthesis enzyme